MLDVSKEGEEALNSAEKEFNAYIETTETFIISRLR
jgi:hypothetical protein